MTTPTSGAGCRPPASLTLQPADTVFSQSVQLPVRGQPSLYPFDTYTIWLGVGGTHGTPTARWWT